MTCRDGSAAAGDLSPTPESAALASHRATLRAALPSQLDRMAASLAHARQALTGPDPEAAFGYLDLLDDRLQGVLSDYR